MNTLCNARDSFYRILGASALAIICVAALTPAEGERVAASSARAAAMTEMAAMPMGPATRSVPPALTAATDEQVADAR